MSAARQLLKEPLLHFAVIAAATFGLHRAFGDAPPIEEAPSPERIVIDDAFVDGLVEQERLATGHAPDRAEVERRWLREERLAREAGRLGLAEHDPILRRRLVQLAELWIESSVEVAEPTDDELAFVLRRDAARYAVPSAVAFEHVFFASRRPDPRGDAIAARDRLRDDVEVPATLGDPFLLGARLPLRTRAELAGSFGPAFADAVLGLEGSAWSEPIESSYGVHLVRPTERRPARAPALAEVRARVRADWMAERTRAEVRAAEERLRERYVVERR
ncbi:MAG: peptidylprolyl isomerase [Sandaracinaceae bacterium]